VRELTGDIHLTK